MKKEIPVLLLTGYLGSGKTTLLNRILNNRKGIRFAVIVNDIGEVNIDADLIAKGGVVGKKDESLVALQNGCICCTLKTDLIEQIAEIMAMEKFEYIVIEASGICEPEPIAQTICSIPTFGGAYTEHGICRLDNIVTVVDAMRMQSEFECGDTLVMKDIEDEDIENLVIQQIEFCNTVLLNKASEVSPKELARIREIVRQLQPKAEIIECDYADVELDKLLNTNNFNFGKAAVSSGWMQGMELSEEEAHRTEHDDDHHHHHHDDDDHDHGDEHHHHDHDEHDHDHECCHHDHEEHHEHHYDEHGVCSCGHHHDHDADEVFTSWGKETAHKYTREALENALQALDSGEYGMILRAKGIVDGGDTWYEFDMVPGEHEIRPCTADVTGKLCVIGSQLKEHNIAELFCV